MSTVPFRSGFIDGDKDSCSRWQIIDANGREIASCSSPQSAEYVANLMNRGFAVSGLRVMSTTEWETALQRFSRFLDDGVAR